jgi:SAM-dependent methyltransferase
MPPFRTFFLLILFALTTIAQAPGQDSKPRREPDVPFVPTPEDVVTGMLKTAGVKKDDVLYDLGCGDGRIVIAAAQKFGTRGVGIDINPVRIKEARENAEKAGVADRVKFIEQDLFDANIADATVVTLYLLPSVNLKLRPKLLRDLKPGTRVVSHSFDMGDWKPDKEMDVSGQRIYYWVIPAGKAAGR